MHRQKLLLGGILSLLLFISMGCAKHGFYETQTTTDTQSNESGNSEESGDSTPTSTSKVTWIRHKGNNQGTSLSTYDGPTSTPTSTTISSISSGASITPVANEDIFYFPISNKIYAVDVSGNVQAGFPFTADNTILSSPTYDENKLFFGTSGGTFYAIDTTTGGLIATKNIGGQVANTPVIDSSNNIYVGSNSGTFYKLTLSGSTFSESATFVAGNEHKSSPVLSADESKIYFGNSNGNIYTKLTSNLSTSNTVVINGGSSSIIESSGAIASDGTMYIGDGNSKLHAINADGSLKWSLPIGSSIKQGVAISKTGAIFLTAGSTLYEITDNGASGAIANSNSIDGGTLSQAIIGDNGTIYVSSQSTKKIHAMDPSDLSTPIWSYTHTNFILTMPIIGKNKLYVMDLSSLFISLE